MACSRMFLLKLLLSLLVLIASKVEGDNDFYENFLEDYNRFKYESSPEGASLEGLHEYDSALSDMSPKGAEKIRNRCMEFAGKARAILDGPEGLVTPIQGYYVGLIEQECRTLMLGYELNGHLFGPVNFLGGAQLTLAETFNKSTFFKLESLSDYSIALQRLGKVKAALEGVEEALRLGVEREITYAEESLSRVKQQFDLSLENLEDPTNSGFFTPFRDMNKKGFNEIIANSIQKTAKDIITKQIKPAMAKLGEYIQDEYLNHTRAGPGISNIANGDKFYQGALDFHTSIKGMIPEKIHQIGLEEMAELRNGVLEVASKLGHENVTFEEFLEIVRADPEQQFQSSQELLDYAKNLLKDKINPKMSQIIPEEYLTEKLFGLDVKPVPNGQGGIAYYEDGNRDGTRNGTYRVNVQNLQNFKKYDMVPLTLHEGNPGHHFDLTVFRFANNDFPKFLHSAGPGIYASFPYGTPIYTSFQEGWGLYSEFLGHELGLYEDPYDLIGFYSFNLLRAARLVVDTGLHRMGWSRQQAIDYLKDNTAMSETNIATEIDRYITWPGQAVAYKIGERAIRKLRKKLEEEQGDAFDVRLFHKYLLSCRGPLDQVEKCMKLKQEEDAKKHNIKVTTIQ